MAQLFSPNFNRGWQAVAAAFAIPVEKKVVLPKKKSLKAAVRETMRTAEGRKINYRLYSFLALLALGLAYLKNSQEQYGLFTSRNLNKENHYDVLGIPRKSNIDLVKSHYKNLVMKYHPDKNPDCLECPELYIKISNSYNVIGNPQKKKLYDTYAAELESYSYLNTKEATYHEFMHAVHSNPSPAIIYIHSPRNDHDHGSDIWDDLSKTYSYLNMLRVNADNKNSSAIFSSLPSVGGAYPSIMIQTVDRRWEQIGARNFTRPFITKFIGKHLSDKFTTIKSATKEENEARIKALRYPEVPSIGRPLPPKGHVYIIVYRAFMISAKQRLLLNHIALKYHTIFDFTYITQEEATGLDIPTQGLSLTNLIGIYTDKLSVIKSPFTEKEYDEALVSFAARDSLLIPATRYTLELLCKDKCLFLTNPTMEFYNSIQQKTQFSVPILIVKSRPPYNSVPVENFLHIYSINISSFNNWVGLPDDTTWKVQNTTIQTNAQSLILITEKGARIGIPREHHLSELADAADSGEIDLHPRPAHILLATISPNHPTLFEEFKTELFANVFRPIICYMYIALIVIGFVRFLTAHKFMTFCLRLVFLKIALIGLLPSVYEPLITRVHKSF